MAVHRAGSLDDMFKYLTVNRYTVILPDRAGSMLTSHLDRLWRREAGLAASVDLTMKPDKTYYVWTAFDCRWLRL